MKRGKAMKGNCTMTALCLLRFWFVLAIVVVPCASYGEVYPTGKQQSLFKEQSLPNPTSWQIRSLPSGKKFHMSTYYGTFSATIQTKEGPLPFSRMPWAKEAIVRIGYNELKDPAVFKGLLENRTNLIMFFGYGHYQESYKYPGRTLEEIEDYFKLVLKARQAFGSRFLCLDYCEWTWGGVSGDKPVSELTDSIKLLNIPSPTNRDEAAAWWDKTYDLTFKRYQDADIPILSWNCSSLNHYEVRKGASYTGNEIAYGNPANDSTFLAFCRGAARQFNVPWGVYAAEYPANNQNSRYRPDERRIQNDNYPDAYMGPFSGPPLSQVKRTLHTSYMAGANFLQRENDTGMLSEYDPLTIDRTPGRIIALRDKGKQHAGTYALLCSEFYDNIVKKHDRGTPYTPIALMFDNNHGFAFKYSDSLAVGAIPYTTADEQMRAVINTIFPHEDKPSAAGPFGEVFDVVTTEAPSPVINSYRAVVLVGGVRVDARMSAVLKQFVENGGLLCLVCEQMTPELWRLAGIADTGQVGTDSAYLRARDFYVHKQDQQFDYHKVELKGAEPLFFANDYDSRIWPVATINRVVKGAVVVGTPVWMNVKGDPSKMHSLFYEIMTMIADELVPVKVYGNEVKVMFNRNQTGWVVTLMNNQGVTSAYPGYKPAEREHSSAGVVLKPRFEYSEATEWLTGKKLAGAAGDANISVIVPPGDIRIVEFREK